MARMQHLAKPASRLWRTCWRLTFVLHEGSPPARGVLALLQNPGYRRFLIGTVTASSGIWVCETALLWLIQTQTKSSTVVGLFLAVVTVPFVAGAFWGGQLT